MLKSRVITASLLLPIIIALIWFLPSVTFSMVMALIACLGLWEWSGLAGFKKTFWIQVGGGALVFFTGFLILSILQAFGPNVLKYGLPTLIIIFWLIALISLYRFPKDNKIWKMKVVSVVTGSFLLGPTWFALVILKDLAPNPVFPHGGQWVLYVLSLIWVADIAAYFVGKRFGKHKLAPKISPGKTWEGAYGALIASVLVIVIGYLLLHPTMNPLKWFLIGLVTVASSIVGDLFESSFKRMRNVKDSGKILPGHGGILDRIDSVMAAVPIFTILVSL